MQENQNTIGKAVKRIFDGTIATVKANSENASPQYLCNINPYSEACEKACKRQFDPNNCRAEWEEGSNTKQAIQYAALKAKSGEQKMSGGDTNVMHGIVIHGEDAIMPPGAKMARRTGQYLISALGNYSDSNQKFVPTSGPNIIPDNELTQMGIDVNKIRESASVLASKMKQADQEYRTLDTNADYNQRQTKEMEIMIKHVSDPVVIKAVEELSNQFINLNIVKLYETQPYFNDFCQGMKPSEQQLQQIKQSLTLAEAVVNGYGNTIQNLLTNFVDKIESVLTRCNTIDPEIIARMRRLYINIKGIMVSKHLNATELTALCKPDLDIKISQQVALCKVSTDAKDALMKKQKEENDALHKRHMMFISLLVILLIIVIVYFTVLKK
jgi:DNA-directed RNA polymerase subunit L